VQTSYSMYPALARVGQILDLFSPRVVSAKIARGIISTGLGVFRPPVTGGAGSSFLDPGESYQNPTPPAAASVTAILASGGASSLSQQVISGTALNGTYGAVEMQPARLVTLVLSSHANWDATNATLRGYNHQGQLVSETLAIPDAGNATVTSTTRFRSIVDLTIPAQSGTAGTFTIGVAVLDGSVTIADYQGVAVYAPVHMSAASTGSPWGVAGANSGSTAVGSIGDNDTFDCLEKGPIAVFTEVATVDGDDVYVRVAAGAGGSRLGAFRTDADTASCVQIVGAKFIRAGAIGLGFARFN
jgi:hypothetical protein